MKKWLLIGIGTVVVIIIALLIVGLSNLGPIIKKTVETVGPKMTKTEVKLDDVGISIFSGEAKLKGFLLGNPKGFKTPTAMQVGSIYVDVDEASLTKDVIVIDQIEISSPKITYETKGKTDNFKAIQHNVKKSSGATKQAAKSGDAPADGGKEKKLIINRVIVTDGEITIAGGILGEGVTLPLPDIELTDIGKDKGGASPAEAFSQIFGSLADGIGSAATSGLEMLKDGAEALQEGVEEAGKEVEEGAESVTKGVKSLFE